MTSWSSSLHITAGLLAGLFLASLGLVSLQDDVGTMPAQVHKVDRWHRNTEAALLSPGL